MNKQQRSAILQQAKDTADYMKNGIHRNGTWTRVRLIYKSSKWTPSAKGIDRLIDALSIHFDGIGFASTDIGAHYEIACSTAAITDQARAYIDGWLARGAK